MPFESGGNQNLEKLSDEELCNMVCAGAREAEEVLATRYSRLVRAISRPFFLVGGDGEDLIQEGMIGLLKAIREYSPDKSASFFTYAEVCVRNRIYSALKSAARDKHAPLNNYTSIETPFPDSKINTGFELGINGSRFTDPEELVIGREAFDEFSLALKSLLSGFEAKVLLYYLDGFSYNDIAERLGKPQKSVDNAVQRMRRKIHSLKTASAGEKPADHKRPM